MFGLTLFQLISFLSEKKTFRGRMGIHTFHFGEKTEHVKLPNYSHLTQSPPTPMDLWAAFTLITFTLCTALPSLSTLIYHHCFCLVFCCFQILVTVVSCSLPPSRPRSPPYRPQSMSSRRRSPRLVLTRRCLVLTRHRLVIACRHLTHPRSPSSHTSLALSSSLHLNLLFLSFIFQSQSSPSSIFSLLVPLLKIDSVLLVNPLKIFFCS